MAGAGATGALIACGRVGRPHGVRGELRIWPLNEFGIVQHVDLPLAGAPVSQ